MGAKLDTGQVLPLVRRLQSCPDPLAVYGALTDGGRRGDTLLLESADALTRQGQRSILVTGCAVRATCRGRRVRLEALGPNGEGALAHLEGLLGQRGEVAPTGGGLEVVYPAAPEGVSEAERMAAASPADALRAMSGGFELVSRPAPMPFLAAGVFAFDFLESYEALDDYADDLLDYPGYQFWLADRMVVIDHTRRHTLVVANVFGGEHAGRVYHDAVGAIDRLARQVDDAPAPVRRRPTASTGALPAVDVDVDDADFAETVRGLKGHITDGDVFQIVPSRTFSAPCADPLRAYAELRTLNPSPYMFYVAGPKHTIFGASPETAVKVDATERTVEIRPIAGTRRRGFAADGTIDRDLDGRIEAELRLDHKEVAEHMMLVDLARNDVARVSQPGSRHVPVLLAVDRYSHVMHLVSHVRGRLGDGLDAMHAYVASMNMGTLTGAPKLEASRLLRRYERTRRGPYGGAVGYLTDRGDMDTAIVIRSAVVRDGTAYVRAGAGVVHDSVPTAEADETRRKAEAVLRSIAAAEEGSDV